MNQSNAYFDNLIKLVEDEQAEEKRLYDRGKLINTIAKRVEKGEVWSEVVVRRIRLGVFGQHKVEIERISYQGVPHGFITGNTVELYNHYGQQGKNRLALLAKVKAVWDDSMLLGIDEEDCEELPDWVNYGSLGVEKVFRPGMFKKIISNLTTVRNSSDQDFMKLRSALLTHEDTGQESVPLNAGKMTISEFSVNLNKSQVEAVKRIVATNDVTLVHGPPGTGKTTTLIEAIIIVLKQEEQVLVSAPSNAAVDLLTVRLAEKGVNVLRIGNPLKIKGKAANHTLEAHLDRHNLSSLLNEIKVEYEKFNNLERKLRLTAKRTGDNSYLKRANEIKIKNEENRVDYRQLEKFISKDVTKKARVILTTLFGAGYKEIGSSFSTVFIDEAAQAFEPAIWIPIRKGKRIIMSGDHHQLPPVVKAEAEGGENPLKVTLFEKLINNPRICTLLNVQYRMHKNIMFLSNYYFYEKRLKAAANVACHQLSETEESTPALSFFDTKNLPNRYERRYPKSSSYHNTAEEEAIMHHLKQLLKSHKKDDSINFSIGLISPYKGQIKKLQDSVKQLKHDLQIDCSIHTESIDSFQGQERDVIYLSLVRSNNKKEIGFLKEYRRMNVAMTRARKKLFIFGDSSTIADNNMDMSSISEESFSYQSMIDFASEIGGYVIL